MEFKKNVSLSGLNSMRVEAITAGFAVINSQKDIQELSIRLKEGNFLILGEGTNTLFTKDFPGTIGKVNIRGVRYENIDDEFCQIRVGAGENWNEFVLGTLNKGLQGLENLSLIPGSVGAAPIQNIGAYGVEVCDLISYVEGYNFKTKKFEKLSKEQCGFSYRSSFFKEKMRDQFLISHVYFLLKRKWEVLNTSYKSLASFLAEQGIINPTPVQVSQAVISIRQSKLPDPKKIGNAGSFFKNPEISAHEYQILQKKYKDLPGYEIGSGKIKIYAGWLIEHLGWKGKSMGKAGVHRDQALVLVNKGGAKGTEVLNLSKAVKSDVKRTFGIELEEEVRIV